MAGHSGSPVAVYGAIVANFIIAVSKFAAGILTGSSAMLSEGIHSVVDTGNSALLLLGVYRSRKPPDERHPFGYGPEIYFWGLIVALILFGVGGGMSIYEGIVHLQHPTHITNPMWNYIVLAVAFVAESVSWTIALHEFLAESKEPGETFWRALINSKDPAVYTVLAEDTAAIAGLLIAFVGIWLGSWFETPYIDGMASILIGVLLAAVAIFLAYETRGLLVGESADLGIVRGVRRIVEADRAVRSMRDPLTMHFGPHEILLALDLQFESSISAAELAGTIDRLEAKIQQEYPRITRIFIEAESLIEVEKR